MCIRDSSDEILGPDVERLQGFHLAPFGQRSGPHSLTPDLKGHRLPYFPLSHFALKRPRIPDLSCLSMEASRKKSEGIVEERKAFSPFVNTSFA